MNISDILAFIDATKRGLATNPGQTALEYGRGAVGGLADMADLGTTALTGMPASAGQYVRQLIGSTGTPVEQGGAVLGIPGLGTAAGLAKGATLAAIMGAVPKKLAREVAQQGAGDVVPIVKGLTKSQREAFKAAQAIADEKTAAVRAEPMIQVPEGEQFWPWRVEHGGYGVGQNKKEGTFFVQKTTSPDEAALQKAIKSAEDAGNYQDVWDLSNMTRPIQQNQSLGYSTSVKGTPQWILDQYGPAFDAKMKGAAMSAANNPEAFKFYWTGQLQKDFHDLYGPEKGQQMFQSLADAIGATTASARPVQNVRMGSYQDVRMNQGLAPTGTPPYPYGHQYSADDHLTKLSDLMEAGRLDPANVPKGATFSGDISGQTGDMTFDKVMSENIPLLNSKGAVIQAPHNNAYGEATAAGRRLTDALRGGEGAALPPEVLQGLLPSDIQSAVWSVFGGDPEYAKALIRHISDRINVTSRVTGMPIDTVKDLFLKKTIPLLGVGGAGVGLSQMQPDAGQ